MAADDDDMPSVMLVVVLMAQNEFLELDQKGEAVRAGLTA